MLRGLLCERLDQDYALKAKDKSGTVGFSYGRIDRNGKPMGKR